LDIGVLGYIGIVQHKEHSPEVLSIPPGTPCICKLYVMLRVGVGNDLVQLSNMVETAVVRLTLPVLRLRVWLHCVT